MRVDLYTDGGVRTGGVKGPTGGKTGPGAAGFAIYENGILLRQGGVPLDEVTVNEAEYSSVILGLHNAKLLGATEVAIHSDSQLIVNQISGQYKCKKAHLVEYLDEVHHEMRNFEKVTVQWVPREENIVADEMTREILG